MVVSRASTASVFSNTITDIGRIRAELNDLQQQVSSGLKSSDFTGYGSDVTRVLNLENGVNRTNEYLRSNREIVTRLTIVEDAVGAINDLASDFRNILLNERSAGGEVQDLNLLANQTLDRLTDQLNIQLSGRSLLAGGKTDIDPVNRSDLNIPNLNGDFEPDARYYKGDALVLSVQASENLTVDYGVKADHPGFQKLIGAIHLGIQAEAGDDSGLYERSLTLINEALGDINQLRTEIGSNQRALEDINDIHEGSKLQLEQFFNDTVQADVVDAATQVAFNEAVLQATLQTFARISRISLVDFIN